MVDKHRFPSQRKYINSIKQNVMKISIVLKTKGSHERNLLRFRYEREYQNAIRKMRKIIRAYRKEVL